jgi:hypothetical protein
MLVLVTNIGQQCWSGEDGGWIGQAAYADDGPEVAIWGRSEPRRAIRGHDIAPAIIGLLELRNRWADAEVVEHAVLGGIEHADIAEMPLFAKLVDRISSAVA